jgi:hypothetical protein
MLLMRITWSRGAHRELDAVLAFIALQKLDALLVSIEQLGPSLSEPSSPRN